MCDHGRGGAVCPVGAGVILFGPRMAQQEPAAIKRVGAEQAPPTGSLLAFGYAFARLDVPSFVLSAVREFRLNRHMMQVELRF